MKIVVTGGAGYIGSVATHRLHAEGYEVVVIDNLSQGHRAALPCGVQFENADIVDEKSLTKLLQAHQPDAVLHFAALTIAPESVQDPGPYWRTNSGGTLALLNAMRGANVRSIVLSSTAAVYGAPELVPVPEASALAPINPYGASKLSAERAVSSYANAYGLSYVAFRYFNVAGATSDVGEDHFPETHLIPSVLDAVSGKRESLTVFGADFPTKDGTAIRDYVHVEDLVDAHLSALEALHVKQESLGAINLGTRDGASVQDVIEVVERVTGTAAPVVFGERRPGDPAILIANASRAYEILGWEPKRSTLDEMVASAWAWRQRFPNGYDDTDSS